MSNPFIPKITTNPGCYLMKDVDGNVVYIGKAKNLRKRVSSYWRARDYKTAALVAEIADIETIVTDTEEESLILEAQLIQQYHPKYNIDLQTPGRYAYIKLTNEDYPRFVIARKITKDGKFFGPYPSAAARNQMFRSANALFRLCSTKRSKRPCFRYTLGQCAGGCAGKISKEEYAASIKSAVRFLHGEFSKLIKETEQLMRGASTQEKFEKARIYRDRLFALRKREEQKLSEPKHYDQDIVNYIELRNKPAGTFLHTYSECSSEHSPLSSLAIRLRRNHARELHRPPEGISPPSSSIVIQLFHFNRGIISGRKEFVFDLDALAVSEPRDVLRDVLLQYYNANPVSSEIIIPEHITDEDLLVAHFRQRSRHRVIFTVPIRGTKKKLLEMVKKNLLTKLGEGGGQLYELQRALNLPELPRVIDCIDISHLSGIETVGSLVQFTNGQATKSGYRKFKIKSVEGINDVASMYEVVSRFGKRVRAGEEKKPDLLLIDGGKGQLNSALRALRDVQYEIPAAGLAKRFEEIYLPERKDPIILSPKSPALQLLRAIRDEAHRFAITFQRKRRRYHE